MSDEQLRRLEYLVRVDLDEKLRRFEAAVDKLSQLDKDFVWDDELLNLLHEVDNTTNPEV